ncbi:MAG: iron chelate uptake ABC transporter family permease subunit [Caldilineaceae bacterium]|nr:iron chelate uptake ABC transporter family permease subunit [Caldilineaceae bacterium]
MSQADALSVRRAQKAAPALSPPARVLWVLFLIACVAVALYLTIGVTDWGFALPRRARKVLAMALVGFAVSYSTVLFQTVTNNKILTPSIIGFDALYVLIQTGMTFLFGAMFLVYLDARALFLMNVGVMILFAGVLYRWLFGREGAHLYFLVLIGVVFGTLFSNLSNFMQRLLDPNEFLVLQTSLFASINNVDEDLLLIAVLSIAAVTLYSLRFAPYLDVLALGRETAINLGVEHAMTVNRLMIVIAVLVSVSTALVGPITFFGLLVANVAYQVMPAYHHRYLIPAAGLISVIALAGGQLLIERAFHFQTTISVVVNFAGGLYFLYLVLKQARSG